MYFFWLVTKRIIKFTFQTAPFNVSFLLLRFAIKKYDALIMCNFNRSFLFKNITDKAKPVSIANPILIFIFEPDK